MALSPVIALVDMDCFFVQVELQTRPDCRGKPAVVAQYNVHRGGSIIAVSYEARAHGVNRNMKVDQAKELCADLEVFRVPECRGKGDLTKYRAASEQIMKTLAECFPLAIFERASIDEAYLDLTAQLMSVNCDECDMSGTHLAGVSDADIAAEWFSGVSDDDKYLCAAATLMQSARAQIKSKTGFTCSAGISHSKTLAKLAAGLNKPDGQTVLPLIRDSADLHHPMRLVFAKMPITKVRNLGGKLGRMVQQQLQVETMSQLGEVSLEVLRAKFGGHTADWLYQLATEGLDGEVVRARYLPQSIGCSKNFPAPKAALREWHEVLHWLNNMAEEICERVCTDMTKNSRQPQTLSSYVSFPDDRRAYSSVSRSCSLRNVSLGNWKDSTKLVDVAVKLLNEFRGRVIISMGLTVNNFVAMEASNDASDIRRHLRRRSPSNHSEEREKESETKKQKLQVTPKKVGWYYDRVMEEELCNMQQENQENSNSSSRGSYFERVETEELHNKKQQESENAGKVLSSSGSVFERNKKPKDIHESSNSSCGSYFEKVMAQELRNKKQQDIQGNSNSSCGSHFEKVMAQELRNRKQQEDLEERFSKSESFFERVMAEEMRNRRKKQEAERADYYYCTKCGESVLMFNAPEHKDFHVAEEAQREFNRESAQEVRKQAEMKARSSKFVKSNKKTFARASSSKKNASLSSSSQVTIDQFFKSAN